MCLNPMLRVMPKRINVLGDIRAETDTQMLQVAFYETPEYRTPIESFDRPIIVGVALVAGFVHSAIDLNIHVAGIRTYVFLRDNIFKAIAKLDPDYSKNIEGRFLRLHWGRASTI